MLSPQKCALCGAEAADEVFVYTSPDVFERAVGVGEDGYSRSWVRCRGCGFHYSRYSRPEDALDRLYEKDYRDASNGWRAGATTQEIFERVIKLTPEESETKQRVSWIKRTLAELRDAGLVLSGKPPWQLLDIGGATGVFAYEFRDADWETHVIDPSIDGAFLERSYGIPFIARRYEPGLFDHGFDVISLVYALEHILEPRQFLTHVRNDLAPGGVVFVEVPDAAAFTRKPPDDAIFNSCHLWIFDPITMTSLLESAGLEVLGMRRIQTARGHYGLMAIAGELAT